MVTKLLLDTNILIDELRQSSKDPTHWKKLNNQDHQLFISAISITELWTGESITTAKGEQAAQKLLKQAKIIPLSDPILKQAGTELRLDRDLYLADALIAATALVKKLPLATLNTRHFQHIKSLKLYSLNPLLDLVGIGQSKTGTVGLNVDDISLQD